MLSVLHTCVKDVDEDEYRSKKESLLVSWCARFLNHLLGQCQANSVVQPPDTNVVTIDCDEDGHADVEKNEKDVDNPRGGVEGDSLDHKYYRQCVKETVSVGIGVRVAELVDLDAAEHKHDVHHCGVELEAVVGGANVVADREEALEDHRETHGVEDTQLL